MAFIDWEPKFSVKVPSIDAQHKKLFALTNELHEAMMGRKAKEVLDDVLKRLMDYTQVHFTYEQEMLAKQGYDALPAQLAMHDAFLNKVLAFRKDFLSGKLGLSIEILDFLSNWLQQHIMVEDMKYADLMKSKGVL